VTGSEAPETVQV